MSCTRSESSVSRDVFAGVAGEKSVAPGFSRGASIGQSPEPALAGERAAFFRALKRARNTSLLPFPPAEAEGYGAYAGYAGEVVAHDGRTCTGKGNLWI